MKMEFLLRVLAVVVLTVSMPAHAATMSTVAGTGQSGYSGDGGPATQAEIGMVTSVALGPKGELYIGDDNKRLIRKVSPDGTISTYAGTGAPGYDFDGVPAYLARLSTVKQMATDAQGNLYIADTDNYRIRKIDTNGIIFTIAGTGTSGYSGDGGPATLARLNYPESVAVDGAGNVYVGDHSRVRKIGTDGVIRTVAGGGASREDGIAATNAQLWAFSLAVDGSGRLYIGDLSTYRIRRVDAGGTITTVVGGGYWTDAKAASDLRLQSLDAMGLDARGNLYIAESASSRAFKVSPGGGVQVVAGEGADGYLDVGSPLPYHPQGIAVAADGSFYIADTYQYQVRKVTPGANAPPPIGVGAFKPFERIPVAGVPNAVAVGDFTGDGRADVVLATTSAGGSIPDPDNDFMVNLFVQQPGGALAAPVRAPYGAHESFLFAAPVLSDLNGDGRKDLIAGRNDGITVFLGNATGTLTGRAYDSTTGSNSGSEIVVTDLDRDGKSDVLVRNEFNNQQYGVTVYFGDGRGGFRAGRGFVPTPYSNGTSEVALGDLNGDGLDDLAISWTPDTGEAKVAVHLHDGVSNFLPAQVLTSPEGMSMGQLGVMSIGDFDGDGRKDLIFGSQDQPHYTENLWLYRQNASGGLDAPREVRTAPFPEKSMAADMNGDGRDDLLVVHRDQTLGYYLQTANGLAPEAPYRTVQNSYYYGHGMAVGDIDSDGCKDVVLATRSDGIAVLRGSRCRVAGTPSDIHADGKSDLLWRDDGRQYLAIWRMNGSARVDGIGYAVSPDWRVLATGDFQGDRKLDVVWTNGVQMQLWEGDGNGGFIGTPMPNYPTGWRVVAAGDINGDGNADLLWRNDANTQAGLWVMRGAQVIDSAGYLTSANWWVAGSGDLNGDGRLDVIWTDGTQMQLWRAASGLGFAGEAMPGYPNGWELTATGDVTGDGMADLMWRHPELGHFAVWAMEGGARLYGQGYQPGPSWRVAQTGDFNGDGRTDVVWTNGGLMQLWQAQGDGFVGVEMPDYPVGWSVIRR